MRWRRPHHLMVESSSSSWLDIDPLALRRITRLLVISSSYRSADPLLVGARGGPAGRLAAPVPDVRRCRSSPVIEVADLVPRHGSNSVRNCPVASSAVGRARVSLESGQPASVYLWAEPVRRLGGHQVYMGEVDTGTKTVTVTHHFFFPEAAGYPLSSLPCARRAH